METTDYKAPIFYESPRTLWLKSLKPDEPCDHRGCLHHVTHPCEGCGRIGGFPVEQPTTNEDEVKE